MFGKISFDRWQCIVEIEIRKKCSFKDGDVLSCAKTVFSQRKPKQAVIDFLTMLPNCKKEIITMEPEELVIDWLNYHSITFFDKLTGTCKVPVFIPKMLLRQGADLLKNLF